TEFMGLHPLRHCPPTLSLQFRKVSNSVEVGGSCKGDKKTYLTVPTNRGGCPPDREDGCHLRLQLRVENDDPMNPRLQVSTNHRAIRHRRTMHLAIPGDIFKRDDCRLFLRYSYGEVLLS